MKFLKEYTGLILALIGCLAFLYLSWTITFKFLEYQIHRIVREQLKAIPTLYSPLHRGGTPHVVWRVQDHDRVIWFTDLTTQNDVVQVVKHNPNFKTVTIISDKR